MLKTTDARGEHKPFPAAEKASPESGRKGHPNKNLTTKHPVSGKVAGWRDKK